MDQRERINDLQESLRAMLDDDRANLWTALVGQVVATPGSSSIIDPDNTVTIQPTVRVRMRNDQGVYSWPTTSLLVKVPVLFPCGGNYAVTFPIAAGDEALVIFTSINSEAWWQNGGVQNQPEVRFHDLGDGFAIIGPRSKPKAISNVSSNTMQLRSLDGTQYIELAAGGVINIKAPGGINIIQGDLVSAGEITAKTTHTVSHHTHGGVQPGSGNTGLPNG